MREEPGKFDRHIKRLHSQKRRVTYFKYGLLSFLVILIFFMLLWPQIQNISFLFLGNKLNGFQVDATRINLKKKFVENPKFVGGGERPYTIIAEKALQASENRVLLTQVKGRFTLKDGNILSVVANDGIVNMGTKPTGLLKGDVNFIYDRGDTEIWTDNVFLDMKKGVLDNKEPVEGISHFGALKSKKGIHINQKESFLRLKGPSDLMIIPGEQNR